MSTMSNSSLACPLTTMLYDPNQGGFCLLERHYARLDSAAKALLPSSDPAPSLQDFTKALSQCVRALGPDVRQRVRVVLDNEHRYNVTATALPQAETRMLNVRLDTAPTPTNPMAAHKSTEREVYETARSRVHADYDSTGPLSDRPFDVLMWNPSGDVTETSIANFAVYLRGPELLTAVPTWSRGPKELSKGIYVTPSQCKGLIAGVMRAELLEKGTIVEGTITKDSVMRYAQDPDYYPMVCFNAVRGMYPVYLMEDRSELCDARTGLFSKVKDSHPAPPNLSIPASNFSVDLRADDSTPGTTPPLTPVSSIRPSGSSRAHSETDAIPESLLPLADPTPCTPFPWRRGAIIDCYDSYTNNLLQLFEQDPKAPASSDATLAAHVAVFRADQISWPEFRSQILPNLDFVILSPGPGSPHVPSDIGIGGDLLLALTMKELAIQPIPVFGICLGHQALAALLGGKVVSTGELVHGRTVPIQHTGTGIFKGLSPKRVLHMIRYNSLTVDPATLPSELDITAINPEDGEVMGLQHKTLPLHGVQFHPESISSRRSNYGIDAGKLLVRNFMDIVDDFWATNGRPQRLPLPLDIRKLCVLNTVDSEHGDSPAIEKPIAHDAVYSVQRFDIGSLIPSFAQSRPELVFEATTYSPHTPFFWLDSAAAAPEDNFARFSYMGPTSFDRCISYDLTSDRVTYGAEKQFELAKGDTFWHWMDRVQSNLSSLVRTEDAVEGLQCGFVGYFGYEMKAGSLPGYDRESLKGSAAPRAPDAQFMFADRLIAFDHWNRTWTAFGLVRTGNENHVQSTLEQETGMAIGMSGSEFTAWLDEIKQKLSKLAAAGEPSSPKSQPEPLPLSFTYDSHPEVYKSAVEACRSHIADGNSYELCLTGQFTASASENKLDHWAVYKHFRLQNPASHAAFVSFPMTETTIMSCSPELFIRFDGANGRQAVMKPIKGTLKRSQCTCGGSCKLPMNCSRKKECDAARYEVDSERVRAFMNNPKETAENLMIADLIRANLLEFCGTSSVDVPKLNALETYENVYSLVSTISGELLESVGTVEGVRRCFPPGSMTGAPKLRSVQLLDDLETTPLRGIYSGCLGFLSLDNRAVFSVVIRTLVSHQDKLTYGAGGAITWLSSADGEWNEVVLKARSVLKERVVASD